jgi:murein DD-endopeptidase MepM/ murein hydrolase activator NlpD
VTAHFPQPLLERPAASAIRDAHARRLFHVDPGNEPPLEVGRRQTGVVSRRSLNLRWVFASILTGLTGGALLGSAIYIASDGKLIFAEPAERAPSGRAGADAGTVARKGDKLVRSETMAAAKQVFRAPMTLRSGEREVIKLRSFVRLATGLSLTSGPYAANIPPFNPLRFFSDSGADRAPLEQQPETSDAEVSVMKSDLSILPIEADAPTLSDVDIVNQLLEEARLKLEAGRRALVQLPGSLMLSRMLGPRQTAAPDGPALFPNAGDSPFRSLEIRVVPENVTSAAKTAPASPDLAFSERSVPLSRGAALDAVLRENGAGFDEARAITAALGPDFALAQDGQQVRLLLAPASRPGGPRQMARAILMSARGIEAIAALNDRGAYVSLTPPQVDAGAAKTPIRRNDDEAGDDDDEGTGVPLYDSLYETALKHDIPRQTVDELVRIFGYDVDFQRRVGTGDGFEFFGVNDDEGGDRVDILSAALKIGSEVKRVFRYQADDGTVEYFDEAGRSLKKFLLRKPVVEARLSSGFGQRFHPIMGYSKMHTGVDWATKTGTPIMAGGNGTVLKAEWSSGYGRRTEIQHANGYVTAYNHQSAFARGLVPGARVRQGQVIGYVGSTGLSTGAHLHYEVIVNGHFVDPLKIRVPRGRELEGRTMAEFNRQREQIEQIRSKAGGVKFAEREAR